MSIKLIVGLRNPGSDYEATRHNVGAWLVEALADQYNVRFQPDKKCQGESAIVTVEGSVSRLLLPSTFMNHSGRSIRAMSQFYQIDPNEILVVHDDLDLPAGRIKLKTDGGHGGHNGLRDTIAQLGTSAFHRLRVGIGHPGHRSEVVNFVLSKPSPQDKQLIEDAIARAMIVMPKVMTGQLAAAMCLLNTE